MVPFLRRPGASLHPQQADTKGRGPVSGARRKAPGPCANRRADYGRISLIAKAGLPLKAPVRIRPLSVLRSLLRLLARVL